MKDAPFGIKKNLHTKFKWDSIVSDPFVNLHNPELDVCVYVVDCFEKHSEFFPGKAWHIESLISEYY